jgi:hypothetical protein
MIESTVQHVDDRVIVMPAQAGIQAFALRAVHPVAEMTAAEIAGLMNRILMRLDHV